MKITGSIVLYMTSPDELRMAAKSFLDTNFEGEQTLYLVDNSPSNDLENILSDPRIVYIHSPENKGFGYGHNLALNRAISEHSLFHFVINPDISVKDDVVAPMINFMELNPDIGMMMPKIKNLDGKLQYLPKLVPSPFTVMYRKIRFPKKLYAKFIKKYELRYIEEDVIYNAPIISGCFTLLRISVLEKVGLYDDSFFMYFEDWDLSRRVHRFYNTVYFPKVSVFHEYNSGANHNLKLFTIFVRSAIYYFNKWGWFFDRERSKINRDTLLQFKGKK